jgi:hypothetical protein
MTVTEAAEAVLVASLGQADLRGDPDFPPYRELLAAELGLPPAALLAEHERRLPSRRRGEFMMAHYDRRVPGGRRYADTFRLPILEPVLDHIRQQAGAAALTVYLVATDQVAGATGAAADHRRNDTVLLAYVITRWLNERRARFGLAAVRGAGVAEEARDALDAHCLIRQNPADYGLYWSLAPLFAGLSERHPGAALYVSVTAGTPGITFGLLLNGIRRFPGACTILYVPDDGAGGRVLEIPIGRDIWRELESARPPAARVDLPPRPAAPGAGLPASLPPDRPAGVLRGMAGPGAPSAAAPPPGHALAAAELRAGFRAAAGCHQAASAPGFLDSYCRLLRQLLLYLAARATGVTEVTPEALQHWATGQAMLALHGLDGPAVAAARAALADLAALDPDTGPVAAACLDLALPALAAVDPAWGVPEPLRLCRAFVGLDAHWPVAGELNEQNIRLDQWRATAGAPADAAAIAACYQRSFFGLDGPPAPLADLRYALEQIAGISLDDGG